MNNTELYHHGVLGMKWGKRKAVTSAKKGAVKKYSKEYDKASEMSDLADKKWSEVDALYTSLGKNKVQRMLAASSNKSAAAKKYSKEYDKASEMSDLADKKWSEVKSLYKDTGSNFVSRVFNNIKYS